MGRLAAWMGLGAIALGCGSPRSPGDRPRSLSDGSAFIDPPHSDAVVLATDEPAPPSRPSPEIAPTPPVSPRYPVGEVSEVPVSGDQPVYVVHAPPGRDEALLYLHGVCGNPTAFDTWTEAITPFGTLVSLQGDEPCKGTKRRRWSGDIADLDRRAKEAFRRVGEERGEPLRTDAVTVLGYSQGALRAEALAARFPASYPRVILMGGPIAPSAKQLEGALAIVLMAGERDRQSHLRGAATALSRPGRPATFIEIPDAGHGEYGPRAGEVMREALGWVFDHASTGAPSGSER